MVLKRLSWFPPNLQISLKSDLVIDSLFALPVYFLQVVFDGISQNWK